MVGFVGIVVRCAEFVVSGPLFVVLVCGVRFELVRGEPFPCPSLTGRGVGGAAGWLGGSVAVGGLEGFF